MFGAEPAFAFEPVDLCGVVIGLAWDVISARPYQG
jgi:hypothetical protein